MHGAPQRWRAPCLRLPSLFVGPRRRAAGWPPPAGNAARRPDLAMAPPQVALRAPLRCPARPLLRWPTLAAALPRRAAGRAQPAWVPPPPPGLVAVPAMAMARGRARAGEGESSWAGAHCHVGPGCQFPPF